MPEYFINQNLCYHDGVYCQAKVSVLSFLRLTQRHSSFSSDASVPFLHLEFVDSEGHNLNQISLVRTRRKIRQQVRFLSIYPFGLHGDVDTSFRLPCATV
jgi:hypothetical protein